MYIFYGVKIEVGKGYKDIGDPKMQVDDISFCDHLDDRKRIQIIFEQDIIFYKEDSFIVVPLPEDRTLLHILMVDDKDTNYYTYKQPSQV